MGSGLSHMPGALLDRETVRSLAGPSYSEDIFARHADISGDFITLESFNEVAREMASDGNHSCEVTVNDHNLLNHSPESQIIVNPGNSDAEACCVSPSTAQTCEIESAGSNSRAISRRISRTIAPLEPTTPCSPGGSFRWRRHSFGSIADITRCQLPYLI